jgi:hypothetical protein
MTNLQVNTAIPLPDAYDPDFPFERFWEKVDKDGPLPAVAANDPNPPAWALLPCWQWDRAKQAGGYGAFWWNGTKIAHRLAWEQKYGPIPDEGVLLHRCDNPSCVRVDPEGPPDLDHFILGTAADNNKDRDVKGRYRRLTQRDNGNAILTAEMVRAIRVEHSTGATGADLGRKYGVSSTTIYRIVNRETWTDV